MVKEWLRKGNCCNEKDKKKVNVRKKERKKEQEEISRN